MNRDKSQSFLEAPHRLPYNPKLKERSRFLRKNMTPAEQKMWLEVLRNRKFYGLRFLRQRPVGNYIVDFYCPALKLIVEIDGEIHLDQKEYDEDRTKFLEAYGLLILRYTNKDILQNLERVKKDLCQKISIFPLMEGMKGEK